MSNRSCVNSKVMRVILRPDTGPAAGLGHLMRSLALGRALQQRGARVVVVGNDIASIRDLIARAGIAFIPIHKKTPTANQIASIDKDIIATANTVIIDSYHLPEEELKQIVAGGKFLVVIDDLGKDYPYAQIVITSRTTPPLTSQQGFGPLYLCSPRYALLRDEFANPPRRYPGICRNVLLTLGGCDPFNLTTSISEALLEALGGGIKVHAVLGPYFPWDAPLRALAERSGGRLVVHNSPFTMFPLMAEADLAVCAGGQTLLELAAMGVPAVAVQVAENQWENLRYFTEVGSAVYVGEAGEDGIPSKVAELVAVLAGDIGWRLKMARRGQCAVDGRGASRAAETLLSAFADLYR